MDRFSIFLADKKNEFERWLQKLLPGSTFEQRKLILKRIEERQIAEERNPPRIAMIGQAGVGKTSTINALFDTDLPVGHIGACTKEESELRLEGQSVDGAKGSLIIYDMPGLGDDITADRGEYTKLYERVLGVCEVAVWIINAASRAMAYDQMMLKEVVTPSKPELLQRLVIGLNQIDLLQPGSWNYNACVPSKTQKDTIAKRQSYIVERLGHIIPGLDTSRIVPYSAKQNFRLEQLFEAMMDACRPEREWVLHERKAIQDYESMIGSEFL